MAMLPNCLCEADFAAGRLVPVLTDEAKLYGPLYAVYPSRKYLSAKVRTFLEHFTRIWPHHRGVRPLPQDSPTS
jgi:DNA-binding transcriptional LysR family regulator